MIAPAPTQTPSSAATIGCGQARIALTRSPVIRVKSSSCGIFISVSGPMISWTSPPELKLPPAPAITTALTSRGIDQSPERIAQLGIAFEGQRVLPLRPVQRHGRDAGVERPLEMRGPERLGVEPRIHCGLSFRDGVLQVPERVIEAFARAAIHAGERARRSSRDGRQRGRRIRPGPSAVSRTIEERRSPGAVRIRTSPSLASFWTSWVALPLETSKARDSAPMLSPSGGGRARRARRSGRGWRRARRSGAAPPSRSPSCRRAAAARAARSTGRRARRHASRGWRAPRSSDLHRLAVALREDQREHRVGDLRRRDQPAGRVEPRQLGARLLLAAAGLAGDVGDRLRPSCRCRRSPGRPRSPRRFVPAYSAASARISPTAPCLAAI